MVVRSIKRVDQMFVLTMRAYDLVRRLERMGQIRAGALPGFAMRVDGRQVAQIEDKRVSLAASIPGYDSPYAAARREGSRPGDRREHLGNSPSCKNERSLLDLDTLRCGFV